MFASNKVEEPVFQFLAGTFHQDIHSPEEAIVELLTVESKEYLESAIVFLTDFIQSEYSDTEKNDYIQLCADGVYFPAVGLEPLQWLDQIIEIIKEAVKSK
ncbi:contact-dependent growth inhibition system immunity protein [Jeotgalibacillus sp. ET6]|uniref:contact-dependent growth inhibition system immunity protein n=1 Tax=Jeotgalibacillus sp. ET6 TaxID=3037260 RepID=UPI002418A498|nr:contact-dependent growth inhibition system immunity protein [Jeotgalibacillus sp. ET6]MDG5471419.1 contact-dependent growth inhibition system immunity protein [Jeotgalibacillus sp. ET6]